MFIKVKPINYNSTILDVMKKINSSKIKLVILVNNNKKVVGVISDGDIRRILIKDRNKNLLIKKFIKKRFIYSRGNVSQDQLKNLVIKNSIQAIPIISKNNILDKVYYFDIFKENNLINNEIFILAGGIGKRLFPLTSNRPKPMLRVGNSTLLEGIINNLRDKGFYRFTISVNYLQEKIINYFGNGENLGVRINYIKEKKPLGTGGSLSLLKIKTKEPIIVINGDIYTDLNVKNLLIFHENSRNDLTVCTKYIKKKIEFGVITNKKNQIIDEKPISEYQIFAGVCVINPKLIRKIKKNKFIKITDLINKFYSKGQKVGLYPIKELWFDVGTHQSLFEVNSYKNINV
jgi:dTDP-glucose pyrophosphorylase